VKANLTQPVLIADFTESSTIFHPSRIGDRIKATLLKQKISADLSKPMRRYDSELEYIPTQLAMSLSAGCAADARILSDLPPLLS